MARNRAKYNLPLGGNPIGVAQRSLQLVISLVISAQAI